MKKKHEIGKSIIRDMGEVRVELSDRYRHTFLYTCVKFSRNLNINTKETNDRGKRLEEIATTTGCI